MTIDILCATYNGAAFLPEFLTSLRAQTHTDWRLWVRDDASSDATLATVRRWSDEDPRIQLRYAAKPNERLGAARSFTWLMDDVAARGYIMFADQDDVWRPDKIERTLAAMRTTESRFGGTVPVLVHTDLTVTDATLRVVHPSFWSYARIHPEPPTLRRLISHNVATGSTIMMNRALRDFVGTPPAEIAMHDWWCACVAATFGHIVTVPSATVLYRQHAANAIGARDNRMTLAETPRAVFARRGTTKEFRRDLGKIALQARAFLDRYGDTLVDEDQRFLAGYARLPERGFVRRKIDLMRFRVLPDRGMLHALGVLIRG